MSIIGSVTIFAVIFALPASLLAGEGTDRPGREHPLAAILPSLDLTRWALAVNGPGVVSGRQSRNRSQGRPHFVASSPKGETSSETSSESRWNRRLYLSAALTISAGILARWTQHEAERSYEKYLQSAGPKRQESTFDRAKHYDRLSGAALATMEAGIILSTYFVFF